MSFRRRHGQPPSPSRAPGRGIHARRLLPPGLLAAVLCSAVPAAFGDEMELVRVGFSRSMFVGVNVTDAQAAMKVWIGAVVAGGGMNVRSGSRIYDRLEDLRAALVHREIELVVASVSEFMSLEKEADPDHILIGVDDAGKDYDEYVLLVHRDSGFAGVDDLRGRRILIWSNWRTCLVQDWLRTLVPGPGGLEPGGSFASLVPSEKLSAVVLPVFFRQADACVVTRWGWQTMGELNPQVGRQLRELASSPRITATVVFFRAGYRSPNQADIIAALESMHRTANGRQMLTLFHGGAVKQVPLSALDSARAIYEQARAGASASKPPPAAGKTLARASVGGTP